MEADRPVLGVSLLPDRPPLEGLRALEAAQGCDDPRPHLGEGQGAERLRGAERPDGEGAEEGREAGLPPRWQGEQPLRRRLRKPRTPCASRATAAPARRARAARAGPDTPRRTPPPRSPSASGRTATARAERAGPRHRARRARSRRWRAPAVAPQGRRSVCRGRSPGSPRVVLRIPRAARPDVPLTRRPARTGRSTQHRGRRSLPGVSRSHRRRGSRDPRRGRRPRAAG